MAVAYMTVFGDGEYSDYCKMAVATLRHPRFGNFKGKIVVFTDNPKLDVEGVELREYKLPDGDKFYWSCRARVDCGLKLNLDAHDYVLYTDVDILFAQDSAAFLGKKGKFHAHYEGTRLWRCRWANAFLTDDEVLEAEKTDQHTINAGFFVLDGGMAKAFLTRWQALLDAHDLREGTTNNPTPEQSVMNAMLYRNEFPYEVMPFNWVAQPFQVHYSYSDAKALHYTGIRKRQLGPKYKLLMNLSATDNDRNP